MAAPRLRVPHAPPSGSPLARTAQQVSDEVELYHRTYTTLLRSSGETLLRVLEPSHRSMTSSLHALAGSQELDLGAFLYSIRRLPDAVSNARLIVMGQEAEVFARHGIGPLEDWTPLEAPARRRRWYDDGNGTMAVLLASASDLDDLIPTLVAFQIEWNKLRMRRFRRRSLISSRKSLSEPCHASRIRTQSSSAPPNASAHAAGSGSAPSGRWAPRSAACSLFHSIW